jgi:MFS family permease
MMISAVFWSILIFALPTGALIDRWSRTKSIGVMAIIWSLATAAGGFTRNFVQLFTTRWFIGAGESGYSAGGTALISAFYKQEQRAKMIGWWSSAIPLGQAIGILLGGVIAVHFGWRSTLGIVALPGLLVAILFFWAKDYKTVVLEKTVTREEGITKAKMSTWDAVKELFRSKSLIINNSAFSFTTFSLVAMSCWLPSYFQRYEGMSIEKSGFMASVVMVLALVGGPLGGVLTDRWYKKKSSARMLFPALTCAITGALMFVAFLFHGKLQFGIFLAMGLFAIMYIPGATAVTQDVVHPGLWGASTSVNLIFQHLPGSAIGPLVVGVISDSLGLEKALLCLPATLLAAAILFFIGSFFYKKDVENVEKME